jgi:hypothetical protein
MAKSKEVILPDEVVVSKILLIRGHKVMLDMDLAELYGVETKQLKRSVRRNIDRFPDDFMFELAEDEFENLRYQFGTSSWGGIRYAPMAFTEQGVAMLSGVLVSKRAIPVNIKIMRIYTKMREIMLTHKELLLKIEQIEKTLTDHDERIQTIFDYLKQFIQDQEKPRIEVGFKRSKRLNEQVKRNHRRFPEDFMFQLTKSEKDELVAKCDHLNKLKFSSNLPYAFTEHGAVMLANVLNSERAVEVNVQIVRIFIKIREILLTHKDILLKIEQIEKKLTNHDERIQTVFDYLKQFIQDQEKPRIEVGFKRSKKT